MPTTTNYGWTTPADTDLVKDGAAAIRTLGSSIDTSVKSLNAGTTAGDIDYYTSATAKARIGIGSAGQVLTVSGGVPSWATASASGAYTQLATGTLSGTTVTLSSISQSYKHLYLTVLGAYMSVGAVPMGLRINGSASSIYGNHGSSMSGTAWSNQATTYIDPGFNTINLPAGANSNMHTFTFYNYTQTAYKNIETSHRMASTAGDNWNSFAAFNNTTAITSLSLIRSSGADSFSGGTYTLFGVN
jgi:hypothetical protein